MLVDSPSVNVVWRYYISLYFHLFSRKTNQHSIKWPDLILQDLQIHKCVTKYDINWIPKPYAHFIPSSPLIWLLGRYHGCHILKNNFGKGDCKRQKGVFHMVPPPPANPHEMVLKLPNIGFLCSLLVGWQSVDVSLWEDLHFLIALFSYRCKCPSFYNLVNWSTKS